MNAGALFIATFLACLVEAVEATTIVLAAGTARDWRSAGKGVFAGLAVLIVAVAIAGPAITLLPLGALRIAVGGLLLVFGLQWIRKAVLRASGRRPLHDEAAIFAKQVAKAASEGVESRGAVKDWYAFTLAFKGVVLEGLEVVFIVLTFGANAANVPLSALAALAAIVVVVILGVVVRGPLSRVPENTLKFVVGIMLTAFGVFWAGEGAGAIWPGSDLALLVLAPAIAVFSLVLVAILRPKRDGGATSATAAATSAAAPAVEAQPATSSAPSGSVLVKARPTVGARLKSFGLFWYDFIFGDDWQVALLIAIAIALTAIVAISGASIAWLAIVVVVAATLPYSIHRALR
jgi:uncharacterized membrane protein